MKNYNWGTKIKALFLAVVMMFALAVNAFAASKSYNLNNSSLRTVTVTTGKGWQYSLGTKKTTVTIQNTGWKPLDLYSQTAYGTIWVGQIPAKNSRSITLKGSGKTFTYKLQRNWSGNTTATVSTNAGSVS